jgi:hypothetical protein
MPEQPADPIHYDMKIPPEPHEPKDEDHKSESPSDKSERAADTASDAKTVREGDRPPGSRHNR